MITAALWGHLVADAMGVPHEFKKAKDIPQELDMILPPGYRKTYDTVPYGTWSDDGALMLALADSLLHVGRFDAKDFGQRMLDWRNNGRYTPDGVIFDIGITTNSSLNRIAQGVETPGDASPRSNGNGSLMRTLPLALFHRGSDQELFLDAAAASGLTHRHEIAMSACGVYCVAARRILRKEDPKTVFETALELSPIKLELPKPSGTGYVLDSLAFAIEAIRAPDYKTAVIDAIRLGNDTDTTACIGGALVALRDGAVPHDWLAKLRGREVAHEIILPFVQRCTQ